MTIKPVRFTSLKNTLRFFAVILGTLLLTLWTSPIITATGSYTWTPAGGNLTLPLTSYLAVSRDGRYMATIASGKVDVSTDYGASWSATLVDSGSVTVSATGKYMLAAQNGGQIYESSDFGATWSVVNSDTRSWMSVTISADGKYIAAVDFSDTVYISSNSGASWSPVSTLAANLYAIAMSDNGKYMYVGDINPGNVMLVSNNFGASWSSGVATSGGGDTIYTSPSGQYVAAGSSSDDIYYSKDYGQTWTTATLSSDPDSNFRSAIISNNGNTIMAAELNPTSGGNVYQSFDGGTSWHIDSSLGLGVAGYRNLVGSSDLTRVAVIRVGDNIFKGYNPNLNPKPAIVNSSRDVSPPDTGFGKPGKINRYLPDILVVSCGYALILVFTAIKAFKKNKLKS